MPAKMTDIKFPYLVHLDFTSDKTYMPASFGELRKFTKSLIDVESMLIYYYKKYVELMLAKNQIMWPDPLHRQTSMIKSFWEWSVASVWSEFKAGPKFWSWLQSLGSY